MHTKTTLVLGASNKPNRISGLAISQLRAMQHSVIAVGASGGSVSGVPIEKEIPEMSKNVIDTVTLYLNASNQKGYYDKILSLNPKRIIFNPGAENPEFEGLAKNLGIQTENACTLVLLSTQSF